MTTNPKPNPRQRIKAVFNRNEWLYLVAGFMAGLLALPFIVTIRADFFAVLQEFVPEAAGIGFTVFVVDRIYRRREAKREAQHLRERLIEELHSEVDGVAARAAEEVKAKGWLEDGSLKRTDLSRIVAKEVD
jgi:hypothetical protein